MNESTADPYLFWKLFDAQIKPILTYAAEVWGFGDVKQIEKVYTFAIKRFLNVPLHSSNKMIYGETGRYPLFITTYVKCIKYWIKLTRSPGQESVDKLMKCFCCNMKQASRTGYQVLKMC